ncbi:MAG: hypothetical protein NC311_15780 [Muribaculaceae bacterium]|nr:hypothetical protein [Muribaculaceae bacterium]
MSDIQMDSTIRDHKIVFIGEGANPSRDSVENLIKMFYFDQFRHFSDPLAPYFLFMSKDSQLAAGIGGCVRMRGYFDWGGAVPAPGFAPYLIPMEKNPLREKYFGTTPAGTCLFFRVIGNNKALGEYQIYIEANFNGYESRDFHLKKAYAVINDFTIGYANSTFSDPAALPPTVDASGPNCKMSATSVLIRWMHNLPKGFSVALSAETPSDRIATDIYTAKVEQYAPDVAAFAQYSWGGGNHVRLSGVMRFMSYRDLVAERNHCRVGWGAQISGVWHPDSRFTVYGCFNGGYGYAGLGGDWLMGNYDLVPDLEKAGRLYAPAAFGGYGALQFNIRPNLFVSATVGGASYHPDGKVPGDEYRSGLYTAANIYWNLTPRIQMAAEFNLGRRENVDGHDRWARRVGVMAQFSF